MKDSVTKNCMTSLFALFIFHNQLHFHPFSNDFINCQDTQIIIQCKYRPNTKNFSCILLVLDQWESYHLKSLTIDKDEEILSWHFPLNPSLHSSTQRIRSFNQIYHIYIHFPETIQFHHTLNAPEVQRKDLKSESKTIETASCIWTSQQTNH